MALNEISELQLVDDGARATIVAERGGLVSRFEVGGVPVLYLDEATLRDPSKNVRGGVPVLYPSPGKLAGDAWAWRDQRGELKQHGFARNLPWRVVTTSASTATLRLETEAQPGHWPWASTLEITFSLQGAALRLEQRVTNRGVSTMPCGVGFHPYFHVPQADKARARVPTRATRMFDNTVKRVVALDGPLDLTAAEVDAHLLDHGASEARLERVADVVVVRGSAEYTHWVVWTLAGRDFVCVEPWTCPGDALNSGERLLLVEPGEMRALWTEIAVEPRG